MAPEVPPLAHESPCQHTIDTRERVMEVRRSVEDESRERREDLDRVWQTIERVRDRQPMGIVLLISGLTTACGVLTTLLAVYLSGGPK